jgi:hypothetical protein
MEDIKNYIIKNKGITIINDKIKEYKTGFTLATDKSRYIIKKSLLKTLQYINDNKLKNYGVWYDEDIKSYGIDTDIIRVNKKSEAVKLCKAYNEKAYFQWEHKKSVYIK